MCGITGILSFDRKGTELTSDLHFMTSALKHRGPDDEGYLFVDLQGNARPAVGKDSVTELNIAERVDDLSILCKAGLGHRRLSIIDTSSAGHQPMNLGHLWLVFNGAVYNYIELREELKALGCNFKSATDTEVVLQAYSMWGPSCVNRFNGMWAFAIYDTQKQELFASRDRTGVKPFYFFKDGFQFAFASEQKALLKAGFIRSTINPAAVWDFMVLNKLEADPESMFKGIHELPPAHSLLVSTATSELRTWRHYIPEVNSRFLLPNKDDLEKESHAVAELIHEAIRIRLRADVTIGSCLSGGIDSSSIVCIVNKILKQQGVASIGNKQKVFTASFVGTPFDETKWASQVVEQSEAEWYQCDPTKDELLSDLEDLAYCQDTPLQSTSSYAQYRVMKLAQEQGVKVLLDGQGGDELFGGYLQYFPAWWDELLAHGQFRALTRSMNQFEQIPSWPHFLKMNAKYNILPLLPKGLRHGLQKQYFNELRYLDPLFLDSYKDRYEQHREVHSESLNTMLAFDMFDGPLKNLLKYEDRSSMRFSIESRTPFSDDKPLIDKLFAMPAGYKLQYGASKALLRKAMRGTVPEAILDRKDKLGFVTPNNQWIKQLRDEIRPYFEGANDGILNRRYLLADFDTFFDPKGSQENYRIFKFIGFALWQKVFGL